MTTYFEDVNFLTASFTSTDDEVLGRDGLDLTGARHMAMIVTGLTTETVQAKVSFDNGATYSNALRPFDPGTGALNGSSTLGNGVWEFKDFIGGLLSVTKSAAAVPSQGTATFTGAPVLPVAAVGTITMTGVAAAPVKAQGTITVSGLPVLAETFQVGTQTFTWVTTKVSKGQVTLGASAAACVTNIVAAITEDIPEQVTAADGAGDTVVITAFTAGDAGNLIVLTEACTNMSVDGAGTLGTTTAGSQDDFRIGGQTYKWVTLRGATGEVTRGATAAAAVTNIVAAVNADSTVVTAADGAGDTVVLTAVVTGSAGNSIVLTEGSANMAVDGAGVMGGTTAGSEETFTVDGDVWTWVVERSGPFEVTRVATAAGCVTEMVAAINADSATVTAEDGAGNTVVLTAVVAGTAGDSIDTTEASTNLSFDAATLGTTTAGVDADAVTVVVRARD